MKVTKDRRGTYPRTTTWTVEDPDGYDYSVGDFDGVLTCFVHGPTCVHVQELDRAIAAKEVRR